MPKHMKIATCCYCGTRAALVFDRKRHELSCSACGAPLHEMKMMPQADRAPFKSSKPRRVGAVAHYPPEKPKKSEKPKKRKRRKGIGYKILEELWDTVEDIFD